MKKTLSIILAITVLLILHGCTTYVTPTRYQESTPFVKDYEILGFFSTEVEVVQDLEDVKAVGDLALESLKKEYPEADDLIDVTITQKSKTTLFLFFWITDLVVTVEGNAIKYVS